MDLEGLLAERRLVVGDGAMGTRLMERGLAAGECAELWNVDRPQEVEAIHRSYVEAGSDFVLTNTFGGNRVALGRHGLDERLGEINAAAADAARAAAGRKALVVGDLGPTGGMLEPLGDLSITEVHATYREQTEALAAAGVDGFIAETFDALEELRVALEAARSACNLPLIASARFRREPSGRYRTMMGDEPERLVQIASETGCAAVGTNCGSALIDMVDLARRLADMTDLPVIVQPNAGAPELVNGNTIYRETPAGFARYLPDVYETGVRIIGGCCGTTVEHIGAIRRFADSLS